GEEEREHEGKRTASLRKRELEQHITTLKRRDEEATETIRDEINTSPAPDGNPVWNANSPAEAADWAVCIELNTLEQQANQVSAAIDANEQLAAESKRLETFHTRVNQLRD